MGGGVTACAADLAGVMQRATSGEGGSIDASVKRVVIGKVRVGCVCSHMTFLALLRYMVRHVSMIVGCVLKGSQSV